MTDAIGKIAQEASVAPSEAMLAGYRRLTLRRIAIAGVLALLVVFGFVLDLSTGPSGMGIRDAFKTIFGGEAASSMQWVILRDIRLPTALAALLVGAALSVAGAEMQTVLDNPLAEPFTLGVSTAASLGAALAIVAGIGLPGLPPELLVSGNAFVFAFGSMLLLGALARRAQGAAQTLVLLGIALFFTFNALTALLQFTASQEALQRIVFWTLGSIAQPSATALWILAAVLALVLPLSARAAWRMTALRLGEERAMSFGIDVARLRLSALMRISLLAASAVAVAGTIGFLGLVGPHIARLLVGEDHRFLLPVSALTGALVMSFASIGAKLILPGAILPIGIVTALVGLPLFFVLILSGRAR